MAKVVKCYICKHPKRREIDEALKAGGESQRAIVRRLCPELKPNSIQRHYALDHHMQEIGADWKPTMQTIGTIKAKSSKTTKRTKTTGGEIVKVHWELPRDLVKKLKHQAVDAEVPVIGLVREILERAL
jgi:hypothetical protein